MKDPTFSEEVRELRQEISLLRGLISTRHSTGIHDPLRIFIERCPGERKPFSFVFRAAKEKRLKMSGTRTAIAITLLLDLEQRIEGLDGFHDTREASCRLLQLLHPELEDPSLIQEQIRVAFYRFARFWEEKLQDVIAADFVSSEERLQLRGGSQAPRILISSSDSLIEDALPKLGQTPMLERLRRERFLFVPGGGRGAERFLEEIYSSSGALEVMSTYARLQLITVPPHLLKKYRAAPEAASRHATMHQRLKDRTLKFTEIIPEQGFEDLLHIGPKSTFSYFEGMTKEEILEHLNFVQHLLKSNSGYNLILTRSDIPFYVGRYSTPHFDLSSFFKIPSSGLASAYSTFAVWGPELGRMAEVSLFDWLLHHPTTVIERDRVIQFLQRVTKQFEQTEGPASNPKT